MSCYPRIVGWFGWDNRACHPHHGQKIKVLSIIQTMGGRDGFPNDRDNDDIPIRPGAIVGRLKKKCLKKNSSKN